MNGTEKIQVTVNYVLYSLLISIWEVMFSTDHAINKTNWEVYNLMDEVIKKANKKHYGMLIISGIICLILTCFTGIKINTQILPDFNTFSGGLPFTWIEFYFPKNISNLWECISNSQKLYYKFDLFVLLLDGIIIKYLLNKLFGLYLKYKK